MSQQKIEKWPQEMHILLLFFLNENTKSHPLLSLRLLILAIEM